MKSVIKKVARAKRTSRRVKPLDMIDYLRIGQSIGKMGYCGECMGCLCYRDFCDYAMALRESKSER